MQASPRMAIRELYAGYNLPLTMIRIIPILAALLLLAGCAHHPPATQPAAVLTPVLKPEPSPDPRSRLTLDEIQPGPTLPAPSVSETARPPEESLELYARGLGQLLNHQAYDAIDTFQKALEIDPNSFQINYSLGQAHLERLRRPNDRAFTAFEHAAAIRPDDLGIHLLLGREYYSDGNNDKAAEHLRLAMQTTQYRADGAGTPAVDYFLARVLQDQGYDRAALDEYSKLIHRLLTPTKALRNDPDIGALAASPQLIWLQIGALYEKHAQYADALVAYEPLAKNDPANFDLQAKVVHMLALLHREDDATRSAADVVERFRGNADSVSLLREVYRTLGREQDIADVLRRLHADHPADRGILFALADALNDKGDLPEAQAVLNDAAAKSNGDFDIAQKRFNLDVSHEDVAGAALVLVMQLAEQPDSLRQINPLWDELIRPARKLSLHVTDLQRLAVPEQARAARDYLVSRLAGFWRRSSLERSSLEHAVKLSPPFAPAFRGLVLNIWQRNDWDHSQKIAACRQLADSAQQQGNPSLAAEVRGISLMSQNKPAEAAQEFAAAQRLGATSPDFQLTYAAVLRDQGNDLQCEQMLWKLVADRPRYDEAWAELYSYYQSQGKEPDALKVLSQWLKADPGSATARLLQASWYAREGDSHPAEQLLLKLLNDHPDNTRVLETIEAFYRASGHFDQYIAKLEELHQQQPRNFVLITWLIRIYGDRHQLAEATRLLDETRPAVSGDPELLYQLAALYSRIGQKQTSQELLEGIVKSDPANGPASNDLGYAWADEGHDLNRAEQLIRVAVAAEPDNQAFLDSMGWVLYKQSKFDEAAKYFEQAIGPAALPDPEILNHFGDDLYRLGKAPEARRQWQRSLERLGDASGDDGSDIELRLQLKQKMQAVDAGKPVNVAPLAPAGPATQAHE